MFVLQQVKYVSHSSTVIDYYGINFSSFFGTSFEVDESWELDRHDSRISRFWDFWRPCSNECRLNFSIGVAFENFPDFQQIDQSVVPDPGRRRSFWFFTIFRTFDWRVRCDCWRVRPVLFVCPSWICDIPTVTDLFCSRTCTLWCWVIICFFIGDLCYRVDEPLMHEFVVSHRTIAVDRCFLCTDWF